MRRILLAGALALACIAIAARADVPTQAVGRVGGPPTTMAVTVQQADAGSWNFNCTSGCSGGGGGSGGGTVSIDGGFLTVGIADGGVFGIAPGQAVGIDQTTPGNTNGVQINAALPAGTNLIGKTGIDQTTPGTTNGVQVNAALPSGTNTIGAVTGPAAAALATSAHQTDGSALSDGVNTAKVQPASTVAAATDKAITVALSPNGASVALLAGSAAIGSLTAGTALIGKAGIDQTTVGTTNGVSVAQIGANTVASGNGATTTGTQRFTLSSDSTGQVKLTDGTNNIGTAANPIPSMVGTNPNAFTCSMSAQTANTQLAGCGLSGAGVSYYIDSVTFSTGAANNMSLVSSTTGGTACASSPATVVPVLYFQSTTGGGGSPTIETPIKVAANSTLCCTVSTATASSCLVNGHSGP